MHTSKEILAVFDTAFGQLLAADPAAFRVKFRKMAASAFAVNSGTLPGSSAKTTGILVSSSSFSTSSWNISSPLS
ncbi:hypothetical protein AB0942_29250 [Streptomyces nodosus]|uniref:hypothetical protein n=1 Tax=Streptomyces nodosus TaxID=40318 RepID=UPI003455E0EA